VSSPFPIEGDYSILWSTSSLFTEGSFSIIAHGVLPKTNNIVAISFNVPEANYGNYFVQFFQPTREPFNAQFKVTPGIFAVPSSAQIGTTIIVKGSGFPADDTGTVSVVNQGISLPISTNSLGSFSVNLTISDITPGNHEILATTKRLDSSDIAVADIQVVSQKSVIIINPLPDEPTPPDDTDIPAPTPNVPPPPPEISKTPISKPVIVSPREDSIGMLGKQSITFKWGAVSEPKGITYTLEVGDNFKFDPPLSEFTKSGLSSTSYKMVLPPGTYYWRVKAVDSQGNQGNWALSPYPFKVGEFPVLPVIAGAIFIIILIVFINMFKSSKKHDDQYYY